MRLPATLLWLLCASFLSPAQDGDQAVVRSLLPEVAELRGLAVKESVPTGRKSREEIGAYVRRRISEEYAPGELELEKEALALLNLLPADFAYEKVVEGILVAEVAGYYDVKEKKMFLAEDLPAPALGSVLVHELTHALGDQHFGLRRFMRRHRGDDDRTSAANALLEGDALAVMVDFAARGPAGGEDGKKSGTEPAAALQETLRREKFPGAGMEGAPRFLVESLLFPYLGGIGFVRFLRARGGWEAVNEAYGAPPASSEQILHPEKYAAGNDPPKEIPRALLDGIKGLAVLLTNVLGEWGIRLVLAEGVAPQEAESGAAGWGGDRYWLVESGTPAKRGLLLASGWDSEAEAAEFAKAWTGARSKGKGSRMSRRGQQVLIGISVPARVFDVAAARWFAP